MNIRCMNRHVFMVVLLTSISSWMTLFSAAQSHPDFPRDVWRTDWSRHSVPLSEIEVNLPKDQIPAIDHPRFISNGAAQKWLKKNEPVVALVIEGRARAYPLQILMWHEIVNDLLAGVPITVTFCPLCYSALAFDRRIGSQEYLFGVSGALRHSDLIMYDHETHSLWQQLSGEAIVGEMTGFILHAIPAQIISFEQFQDAYPDGDVLSRDTGFTRRYGTNPYAGYDDVNDRPWMYKGEIDSRLKPMEKVVTLAVGEHRRAYPHRITKALGVINDEIGGLPIVIVHTKNGAVSALDKSSISKSAMIGSTGVFERTLSDGQILTFVNDDNRTIDDQTGSEWSITGKAIHGPLEDTQLVPIAHGDIFAFAWLVIEPDTEIYEDK